MVDCLGVYGKSPISDALDFIAEFNRKFAEMVGVGNA